MDTPTVGPDLSTIPDALAAIAHRYPGEQVNHQLADIPRITDYIRHVTQEVGGGARVCDIGGGTGLFSPGCAHLGFHCTLVDDFRDPINVRDGLAVLDVVHRPLGVKVINRNVIDEGIDFPPHAFDAVTCFDSMEHWHHSPKRLFHQLIELLRPGGLFFLAVPNCKSVRKRLTYPLGFGKWSQMCDWYEQPHFRGHVREPDVDDLRYIARDLRLSKVRIVGRNWRRSASAVARLSDVALRMLPAICADIYLLGTKGAEHGPGD